MPPTLCHNIIRGVSYHENSFEHLKGTTITNCRISFIDLYLVFPTNFRIVFLPHINTLILLEPYRGTITEPGLPMVYSVFAG